MGKDEYLPPHQCISYFNPSGSTPKDAEKKNECIRFENSTKARYFAALIGMWRSLVAYTPGGRGVAGSNPVIPTY